MLSYSNYFLPLIRTNCRLPRNMPFEYPEPDESSLYSHIAFKANFNIILASKLSFPKQSHVPSTNQVRGNMSTHAYSVLDGTATNRNILTICLSIVNGILQRVTIRVKIKCSACIPVTCK
jgi:hypothetical protein